MATEAKKPQDQEPTVIAAQPETTATPATNAQSKAGKGWIIAAGLTGAGVLALGMLGGILIGQQMHPGSERPGQSQSQVQNRPFEQLPEQMQKRLEQQLKNQIKEHREQQGRGPGSDLPKDQGQSQQPGPVPSETPSSPNN